MARSVPYRVGCSQQCRQAQQDALRSTFFIVRQTGPTAFVIKDDADRVFKVFLGDEHQCTCSAFQRDRELCKHICWLLLRRFRVPRTNPIVWQRGLVEREISELLRGLSLDEDERKRFYRSHAAKNADSTDTNNEVGQRPVAENDVCPICQEEFLAKKLPLTYCRHGCGNNVHIKCMKVWLDHQVSIGEKTIKCPLCRQTFGTPEQLKQEFRTSEEQQTETSSVHLGYSCHRCRTCPITGNCYKCTTCEDYFLCQTCFNLSIHNEHSFDYRERSFQRWKVAIREHLTALPEALHHMLATRTLNDDDHEILLQLENARNTAIGGIPENIVRAMPTERVHNGSRLLEQGEQCRVCLRAYEVGERVRRLPCRHQFHVDCIDGWLLHSHPTCPVDGQVVWSAAMNTERKERKRPSTSMGRIRTKAAPASASSSILTANMGLTIVPYRMRTRANTGLHQRLAHTQMSAPFRALLASMSLEFPLSLDIPTRITRSRQSTRPTSTNVQQSLLQPSSSSTADNDRKVTDEFSPGWTASASRFNYRLRERRCSSAK